MNYFSNNVVFFFISFFRFLLDSPEIKKSEESSELKGLVEQGVSGIPMFEPTRSPSPKKTLLFNWGAGAMQYPTGRIWSIRSILLDREHHNVTPYLYIRDTRGG